MRQVNGWGFKRIASGQEQSSYSHDLFVRDNPDICLLMKRIRKPSAIRGTTTTSSHQTRSDLELSDFSSLSSSTPPKLSTPPLEQTQKQQNDTTATPNTNQQHASPNNTAGEATAMGNHQQASPNRSFGAATVASLLGSLLSLDSRTLLFLQQVIAISIQSKLAVQEQSHQSIASNSEDTISGSTEQELYLSLLQSLREQQTSSDEAEDTGDN